MKNVLNPTTDDFTVTYDLDEDRVGEAWTAPALEITEFPDPVAEHVAKHLAQKILIDRGVTSNWDDELKAQQEELLV